jgi:hypothetical protein
MGKRAGVQLGQQECDYHLSLLMSLAFRFRQTVAARIDYLRQRAPEVIVQGPTEATLTMWQRMDEFWSACKLMPQAGASVCNEEQLVRDALANMHRSDLIEMNSTLKEIADYPRSRKAFRVAVCVRAAEQIDQLISKKPTTQQLTLPTPPPTALQSQTPAIPMVNTVSQSALTEPAVLRLLQRLMEQVGIDVDDDDDNGNHRNNGRRNRRSNGRGRNRNSNNGNRPFKGKCFRCGEPGHRVRDCPCPYSTLNNVEVTAGAGCLRLTGWVVNANNGTITDVPFLVDTGASQSFVSPSFVEANGLIPTGEQKELCVKTALTECSGSFPTVTLELLVTGERENGTPSMRAMQMEATVINDLQHDLIVGMSVLRDTAEWIHLPSDTVIFKDAANYVIQTDAKRSSTIRVTDVANLNTATVTVQDPEYAMLVQQDVFAAIEAMDFGDQATPKLRNAVARVLFKHPHVVSNTAYAARAKPSTPSTKHYIALKPGTQPRAQQPYRCPIALQDMLRQEIDNWIEAGVCEKADASEWASPMFLVQSSSGKWRGVVDYRYLNEHTKEIAYPMSRAQEIYEAQVDRPYRSCLDLSKSVFGYPT